MTTLNRTILAYLVFLIIFFSGPVFSAANVACKNEGKRVRDYGIKIGILPTGPNNAITDVAGVKVGHCTLIEEVGIRTGVTAVLPHGGNIFQEKVPAAIYIGNGFGKLAGYTQVEELGNIETPIVLTNTLSVPTAVDALIDHTFSFLENKNIRSVNPVVGETNDGYLNDIRGRHIAKVHVLEAIRTASSGPVAEGAVGAGTGTTSFGFKGGIGTSSRVLPQKRGGYTVGVLVQSNFGGVLQINGAPVGVELGNHYLARDIAPKVDGSCMIVVMTDAPLSERNLKRLAKRAMMGLARTGGIASNGSGDYVIAVSTAQSLRISYTFDKGLPFRELKVLRNGAMSPLFLAVIEATEEAILNSLFACAGMKPLKSRKGDDITPIPVGRVLDILKKYNRMGDR